MKKFTSPERAIRYIAGADFDMHEETWNIGLGYGVERRKGNTRLQGMWGYTGFIGVGDTFAFGGEIIGSLVFLFNENNGFFNLGEVCMVGGACRICRYAFTFCWIKDAKRLLKT